MKQTAIRGSDLLVALQELVEALDGRRPHLERAGEAQILFDVRRLRVNSLLADVYVVCGTGVASAASGISTTQMHPLPGRF